jgi:hypothetical protein
MYIYERRHGGLRRTLHRQRGWGVCVLQYGANVLYIYFLGGFIYYFFSYYIQHCFICRPSDSTVPTDAGIEPRTVATGAQTL